MKIINNKMAIIKNINRVEINRQKILQLLIEKFSRIIKNSQTLNNFPFGDCQLSRPQVMILFFIAPKKNGATVKELAKFMQVTPGAVTQFIDILVKKKLVSREGGSGDRRSINIKLTSLAKKQFSHFKKEYLENIGFAFSSFSTAEIYQFIKLISKIKPI